MQQSLCHSSKGKELGNKVTTASSHESEQGEKLLNNAHSELELTTEKV